MLTITEIEKQEEELQFKSFDNDIAHEIGLMLFRKAREYNYPVAINITRNGQSIFYIALTGATNNNENWLRRKINTANHFQNSSMIVQLRSEQRKKSLSESHGLSDFDYAAAGGAFPIKVRGVGMIGTIAVSGLASEEDHMLIVDCLREYFSR